jgi:hypothetical protein
MIWFENCYDLIWWKFYEIGAEDCTGQYNWELLVLIIHVFLS